MMGVAEHALDDATQEVFLIAHRKLGEFEGRARLGTWLHAIAYRVGANYRRRFRASNDEFDETKHSTVSRSPEEALSSKESAELLQVFCNGLSDKLRDVFILCFVEEQSQVDAASILGLSENTVYSRVRLLRESLREFLDQRGVR